MPSAPVFSPDGGPWPSRAADGTAAPTSTSCRWPAERPRRSRRGKATPARPGRPTARPSSSARPERALGGLSGGSGRHRPRPGHHRLAACQGRVTVSPDGLTIAYAKDDARQVGHVVVQTVADGAERVLDDGAGESDPAFDATGPAPRRRHPRPRRPRDRHPRRGDRRAGPAGSPTRRRGRGRPRLRPLSPAMRRERAFLLASLFHRDLDLERLRAQAAGPLDWALDGRAARPAAAVPLLWNAVAATGLEAALPGGAPRRPCAPEAEANAVQTALHLATLARLSTALRGAGVEALALKGVAARPCLDPAYRPLRHLSDLDLLLRAAGHRGGRRGAARAGGPGLRGGARPRRAPPHRRRPARLRDHQPGRLPARRRRRRAPPGRGRRAGRPAPRRSSRSSHGPAPCPGAASRSWSRTWPTRPASSATTCCATTATSRASLRATWPTWRRWPRLGADLAEAARRFDRPGLRPGGGEPGAGGVGPPRRGPAVAAPPRARASAASRRAGSGSPPASSASSASSGWCAARGLRFLFPPRRYLEARLGERSRGVPLPLLHLRRLGRALTRIFRAR